MWGGGGGGVLVNGEGPLRNEEDLSKGQGFGGGGSVGSSKPLGQGMPGVILIEVGPSGPANNSPRTHLPTASVNLIGFAISMLFYCRMNSVCTQVSW